MVIDVHNVAFDVHNVAFFKGILYVNHCALVINGTLLQVLSKLLSWMWFAHLKTMFYKILVHAGEFT